MTLTGLVTALALAMLTDRALLVRDFSPEGFFGSFAPEFDCEGTAERFETVAAMPGCRHVRAAFAVNALALRSCRPDTTQG